MSHQHTEVTDLGGFMDGKVEVPKVQGQEA